jgi:hypothetical protein
MVIRKDFNPIFLFLMAEVTPENLLSGYFMGAKKFQCRITDVILRSARVKEITKNKPLQQVF